METLRLLVFKDGTTEVTTVLCELTTLELENGWLDDELVDWLEDAEEATDVLVLARRDEDVNVDIEVAVARLDGVESIELLVVDVAGRRVVVDELGKILEDD